MHPGFFTFLSTLPQRVGRWFTIAASRQADISSVSFDGRDSTVQDSNASQLKGELKREMARRPSLERLWTSTTERCLATKTREEEFEEVALQKTSDRKAYRGRAKSNGLCESLSLCQLQRHSMGTTT
jgi:hypothetical protein